METLVLLLLATVGYVSAQTLVQFEPSVGNSQYAPVAAGFAYAFRAPVAAKSYDSYSPNHLSTAPFGKRIRNHKVTQFIEPVESNNAIVPVYHAALPRSNYLVIPQVVKTQYHSQDELGQYAFGYVHNDASHHEERTFNGDVSGSYSYYDDAGVKQSANYIADRYGYRIKGTNVLSTAPVAVEPTPEVRAATLAHLKAVNNVRARKLDGRHIHVGIAETPEVAAARAAHLKIFNRLKRKHARRWRRSANRQSNYGYEHQQFQSQRGHNQQPYYRGPYASHAVGVPVTPTPAVQSATNAHLHALNIAHKYGGTVNVGIPDTPAVEAAKQAHFYAYDQIKRDHARRWKRSAHATNYNYQQQFAPQYHHHSGPQYHQQASESHFPPIPVTATPEVQAATYAHLQAVNQAHTYGGNVHVGIPDTPQVSAAKHAHLKAFDQIKKDHAQRWRRSPHYSPIIDTYHRLQHVQHSSLNDLSGRSVFIKSNTKPLLVPGPQILKQYHSQDELGRYEFGYSGGPSSRHEQRGLDGVTRGHYTYYDANGHLQKIEYEADDYTGFKIVSATNMPQSVQSSY